MKQDNSKPWYVYLVLCKDGALYTGISPNPDKRVELHNAGLGAKYIVPKKRPVELIYVEETLNQVIAARREYEIKTWNKVKKIGLINSSLNQVKNWV